MAVSLAPKNLKRYGEIARLMIRYGRSDLASAEESPEARGISRATWKSSVRRSPTSLRIFGYPGLR